MWLCKLKINKFNALVAMLAGLSIPLSTGLENICLVLIPLAVILTVNLRVQLSKTLQNKFVLTCVIVFALFVVASFWSSAPLLDIKHMLVKMMILAVVPFAYVFFYDNNNRKIALIAYFLGVLVTLILSYASWVFQHPILHGAAWAGVPGDKSWGASTWCPFRAHAYHCYFLGLAAVILFDLLLRKKITQLWMVRGAWVLIILITLNIFYLVASRTGQIAYLMMLVMTLTFWKPKKGSLIALVFGVVFVPLLIISSPAIQKKISQAQIDLVEHSNGDNQDNSIGLRMTFHKYAKILINEKPMLGHGTGSYPSLYTLIAAKDPINSNRNPHSDYLFFGVELGYVGMFALGAIFLTFACGAYRKTESYRSIGLVIPITYAIICLENSFLTDSVTGVAFVFFAGFILSKAPIKATEKLI